MRLSALLTIALTTVADAAVCNGIDYPNGDFVGDPIGMPEIGGSTGDLCQAMCETDPQCVNSVFIPSACDPTVVPPTCYLKALSELPVERSCRCSAPPQRPICSGASSATIFMITSGALSAGIGSYGLTSLSILIDETITSYKVETDTWSMALSGWGLVNSSCLAPPVLAQTNPSTAQLNFTLTSNGTSLLAIVTYEVMDGWSFIRKSISLLPGAGEDTNEPVVLGSASPWDTLLLMSTGESSLTSVLYPSGEMGQYGAFLRWSDGTGVLAAVSNPFLYPLVQSADTGAIVHVGYHPAIAWDWISPFNGDSVQSLDLDAGVLALYSMPDLPGPIPPFSTPMSSAMQQARTKIGSMPAQKVKSSHLYGTGSKFSFSCMGGASHRISAEWLDASERDAFRTVASKLAVQPPTKAVRLHIPWTENDYQIGIDYSDQWPQYQRILNRISSLGVKHILFAGSDYSISNRNNNTDDWGWEQTLWLSNGQHIREGYWYPRGLSSLPPTTASLVAASAAVGVNMMPYVYPILGFRNATWESAWLYGTSGGKFQARLDSRVFQDWFIQLLVDFSATADVRGAGFDYTFFEDVNATTYAQWAGWRRILALTRQQLSDATLPEWTVDNRQLSHSWSPWMWAAGSYAEPFQTDEGPYSWPAFTQDPHTDRQSGNRQRQMNFDYANSKFCPSIALPGFIGHQSDRFDSSGGMPVTNSTLNIRDYDYYGAVYGLISSLATGPVNHVVCGIPARDQGEYDAFPAFVSDVRANSIEFYNRWFDWSNENRDVLLQVKPLPVPPGAGVVDGTYAMLNNTGYLFLFNPNSRAMLPGDDVLAADGRLGVNCMPGLDVLVIGEVWPVPVAAFQTVPCGQRFGIMVEGRAAVILNLTVQPASHLMSTAASIYGLPALLHGSAVRAETSMRVIPGKQAGTVQLDIQGVHDLHRTSTCLSSPLYVMLPTGTVVESVIVGSSASSATLLDTDRAELQLAGCPSRATGLPKLPGLSTFSIALALSEPSFQHSSPITGMEYNASFAGGTLVGTVNVPQAVFDQLAARNSTYPVPWTSEDASIPWLLPGRLIAAIDAGGAMALTPTSVINATLDGLTIIAQPVWSCRSLRQLQCFSGFWFDLTLAGVTPGVTHTLSLTLPPMPVGAFQGVYYDNVDSVYA